MENLLTGSIISSGYLLNKQSKNIRNNENIENLYNKPNNQFIYHSDIHNQTKNREAHLVNNNFDNAKNAIETNIIPPEFNNNVINLNKSQSENNLPISSNDTINSSLTGLSLEKDKFIHNNMIPFFGSKVRQNIDINKSDNILANHTGIEHFSQKKKRN